MCPAKFSRSSLYDVGTYSILPGRGTALASPTRAACDRHRSVLVDHSQDFRISAHPTPDDRKTAPLEKVEIAVWRIYSRFQLWARCTSLKPWAPPTGYLLQYDGGDKYCTCGAKRGEG